MALFLAERTISSCFPRANESDRAADVVEDQQALFIIECEIIMSESSIVADMVEGLHRADAGCQNTFGHFRFDETCYSKGLHIFLENTVQRLLSLKSDAPFL